MGTKDRSDEMEPSFIDLRGPIDLHGPAFLRESISAMFFRLRVL